MKYFTIPQRSYFYENYIWFSLYLFMHATYIMVWHLWNMCPKRAVSWIWNNSCLGSNITGLDQDWFMNGWFFFFKYIFLGEFLLWSNSAFQENTLADVETEKLSCHQYKLMFISWKTSILKVIPAISFLCAFIVIGWSVIRNVFYKYIVIVLDVNEPLKGNSTLYTLMPSICQYVLGTKVCTVLYSIVCIFPSDVHKDRFYLPIMQVHGTSIR